MRGYAYFFESFGSFPGMSDGPATAMKEKGPDPLLGRVIAERFKIVELIARGGMGKVYRAEQAPLQRVCAIKILNPNYNGDADPEFHRRFFREASTASKITHPNSVTIFDYGVDDDIYYMAMEYLEGQTLHHALREMKTLPEERAGRIAQQICRALREAHAIGVIHRDLKPANIFLTRHGDDEDFVKVLDFGLVKHIAERPEEQLTQTGLFMGSPKYMAPEQIQGAVVDARTDIYSLGIMMYEMLAGKVPFDRPTSVNILMAHVGEPPPAMREVNPNLVCSPVFEDLVMRCIAKDPAERFRSMDEVLQAIKHAHGVSMTGQLAAVMASGSYMPPPMRSSSKPGGVVLASGPYTPAGIPRSSIPATPPPTPLLDELDMRPRRSRAWIFVGVVLAAVLGGLLGMAAFRMTAPQEVAVVPPPPATTTSAAPVPPPSATVEVRTATLHVVTDPAGASVREDATEVCASTPCDVVWKGDAADPTKTHKLAFFKNGFKPETKSVKAGDAPITVKLPKAPAGGGGFQRPPPPPPPNPTKTTDVPNGFKDVPIY
jgi:serine/threonine protein kinase